MTQETQMSNTLQKAGMTGNVVTNFTKNDIAVLVSCNDRLCRAITQFLIDKAWKYLSYPLMEAKIFILSCTVGIKKYKVQIFRLSIWMHLVTSNK